MVDIIVCICIRVGKVGLCDVPGVGAEMVGARAELDVQEFVHCLASKAKLGAGEELDRARFTKRRRVSVLL